MPLGRVTAVAPDKSSGQEDSPRDREPDSGDSHSGSI